MIRISLENLYANVTFVSYIIFQLRSCVLKYPFAKDIWGHSLGGGAVNMDGPTKVVSP